MKIKGIVSKVSAHYPYSVEVAGKTFTSHFQFKVGQKVELEFEGKTFDFPWGQGFIICSPNGLGAYPVSDACLKLIHGDSVARHCCYIPYFLQEVVLTGKPMKWTQIESFYEYHYTAEYDANRRVLITNYAIRC